MLRRQKEGNHLPSFEGMFQAFPITAQALCEQSITAASDMLKLLNWLWEEDLLGISKHQRIWS